MGNETFLNKQPPDESPAVVLFFVVTDISLVATREIPRPRLADSSADEARTRMKKEGASLLFSCVCAHQGSNLGPPR